MQGPYPDIVRLLLLTLFFGIQQRKRPRTYVWCWYIGWNFILLSYAVWVIPVTQAKSVQLQSAASFDMMLLGLMTFLISVLADRPGLRKIVLSVAPIGVMNVLVINAHEYGVVPKLLLLLAVVLWQCTGFYVAYRVVPRERRRTRTMVLTTCVAYGMALIVYVVTTQAQDMDTWAVSEVVLCLAMLYAQWGKKRSIARWVGTVGFVAWAAFYFANLLLPSPSAARHLMDEFWNFPKFFVAITMILKIFEDETAEQARMAGKFKDLYDDFRLIYETHPYPMWICAAQDGRFLTANVAAVKAYGYGIEELKTMRVAEFEAPMEGETEGIASMEETPLEGTLIQHRHKDGHMMWVNLVDREIMYLGQEARFVMARDITERLKLDLELSRRAQHDALTGLPNRQLFADRMGRSLVAGEREDRKVAILTIDVDHFKMINDTYGHLVGDECLKMVAARLSSKIRKADTIARTGGEEFMAIVGGLSHASDAEKVTASLLRVFEAPLELPMGAIGVTVSIGVAVFPDDATDAEVLRQLSDEALYRAKRAGRNRAAYAEDVSYGEIAV